MKKLLALLGLATITTACDIDKSQPPTLEETVNQSTASQSAISQSSSDNNTVLSTNNYLLTATPVNTGQTSNIFVSKALGFDDSIEEVILYEDGVEIARESNSSINHEVIKTEPGTYVYSAQLRTESGLLIDTDPVQVNFSGEEIDLEPYAQFFICSPTEAAKGTDIYLTARDIGDNKGIKRVILFEDGKEIQSSDSNLFTKVEYDSPQTHTYHAEIEDIGGNVVTTESIDVAFTGEALAPEISWANVNPSEPGRTTTLFCHADDPNVDSQKGIEKVVLYEDGKSISEDTSNNGYFLVQVTRDASEHEYHFEATNKNGKTTKSDPMSVTFKGQDLPPELDWWHVSYDTEKNVATVLVQANDKENVRDDSGIRQITLYENGEAIETTNENTLLQKLSRSSGEKTYYAEVTNYSGITTRTEEVRVNYEH